MMKKEEGRKVRTDKKRKVSPTIHIRLKEAIYRLSYISDTPVKDIGEAICDSGLLSKEVIESLSKHFRRSVRLMNTMYMGDLAKPPLQKRSTPGTTDRITIRFPQHTYENITALAYALDVTPSKATALLLEASIHNPAFLNDFFKDYLQVHLGDNRLKELNKIIKYINDHNPYEGEISYASLLSTLQEEKDGAGTLSETFIEFISHWKK